MHHHAPTSSTTTTEFIVDDSMAAINKALWVLKCDELHARIIIIIIMNFYSPVSNTKCHSIGHKMRIARIKIRVLLLLLQGLTYSHTKKSQSTVSSSQTEHII